MLTGSIGENGKEGDNWNFVPVRYKIRKIGENHKEKENRAVPYNHNN